MGTPILMMLAAAIAAPAQTFTTLAKFHLSDGAYSRAGLVQGLDGNLYGTTTEGGNTECNHPAGCGTVFKLTPAGTLTALYAFCPQSPCTDGRNPYAGLSLGTDGNLYGTTYLGGAHKFGSVFKITPGGRLTTLYSFCALGGAFCSDGSGPLSGLVLGSDGDFYGTTQSGGSAGYGTVFRLTPAGDFTNLYTFCSLKNCADGASSIAGLVQGTDGNFYGTTAEGGAYSMGTVFKITPTGLLTTLYSFCAQSGCPDGDQPGVALVQAVDGDFYGTTQTGGASRFYGTAFRITPEGALTTLHSFCSLPGCADGNQPNAPLVQANDDNFYGTTTTGGVPAAGTIFKLTPDGVLTTLYTFCSEAGCPDGDWPFAPVFEATSGTFYGTSYQGGIYGACSFGCGTAFSLSSGLQPFVRTLPTSGRVGTEVDILGTGLSSATSVTFDGAPAVFQTLSSTEILAYVPADAGDGKVEVVTPARTFISNVPFRVTP
jgi:uncharacterized repeat protein (TIGR03803 family)